MGGYFSGPLKRGATDHDKAEYIRQKFTDWNNEASTFYSDYDKYFDAYEGNPRPRDIEDHPDDPNYHVPHMETFVDTILGQVFLTIFNQTTIIRYNPLNYESILPARIMERVVHYQITHAIPDAFTHLLLWVLDALVGGLGFLMLSYGVANRSYKEEQVVQIKDMNGMAEPVFEQDENGENIIGEDGLPIPIMEEVLVRSDDYEGLILNKLNIRDVSTDWSNLSLAQGPLIVREWIDPEDYFDRVEINGYPELSEEQLEKLITVKTVKERTYSHFQKTSNTPEKKIEILNYYGKGWADVGDDKKIVLQKITVLKASDPEIEDVVLEEKSIPFIPVFPLKYKPVKTELAGRGVAAQIYDLNEYEDAMYNAMILNVSHTIHKGYKIGTQAGVKDLTQLQSRPGQLIFADRPELIQEIVHSPLPSDAYNMQGQTYQYMQDVTAAQDVVQGMVKRQTAPTTASILNNNAKRRLDLYVFRMLREALTNLGNGITLGFQSWFQADQTITAVLTEDEISKFKDIDLNAVRVQGNLLEVTMDALQSGKFYATTAITALDGDKNAKQQELLQLIQTTQGAVWETGRINPETGRPIMERINIGYLVKQLINEQGREDLKSIIIEFDKPEEQPQQQTAASSAPVNQEDQLGPATMSEAMNIDEMLLGGE